MDTAVISALSALGGAIIGTVSMIAMNFIQQKAETRRKLDEVLVNGAINQWSKYLDLSLAGQAKPGSVVYPPLVYILCLSQFAGMIHRIDKMSDKEIEVGIAEAYRKIDLITDASQKADLARNSNRSRNGDA